MARAEKKASDVLDALSQGQVDQARNLLNNGYPFDLRRATEVVIERGWCEALQFLINEYNTDVNTNFLLHQALFFQHKNMVRLLVELEADVNQCQMTNISKSVRNAVQQREDIADCSVENIKFFLPLQLTLRCNVELMSCLLHSGANVNRQNGLGETTLMSACTESVDVQRVEFLLQQGAQTNLKNLKAETALHLAAETGNSGKVRLLIDHGADVEARTNTEKTALMYACDRSVGVACLTVLLQNEANPNSRNEKAETAVHLLAELGDTDKLQVCVQHNANVNATDKSERTPLIVACASDTADVTCVRFLLENNALPNMTDKYGQSPLHRAAGRGNLEKLQVLIQHKANVNARDRKDQTPLMVACASDTADLTCVRFLLENNALPNMTDKYGQSPLHRAAGRGNLEKLQVLIQHKANVNARDRKDQTPLMVACASDTADVTCVRFLLQNNAFSDMSDKYGQSPLHRAAGRGNVEKLQELVKYNANINDTDCNDQTPLMMACASDIGDVECIRFLLQKSAVLNITSTFNIQSTLHIAADQGSLKKLQLLVQYKADVNARGGLGQTPLMVACASNTADVECVKYLLQNNALPNERDIYGQSALHITAKKGNLDKLEVLVQYNADVNATDNIKQTPLIVACVNDTVDVACVRFLLKNNALPNMTDCRGYSALHHSAFTRGNLEKLRVLVQYHAHVNIRDDQRRTPLMLACDNVDFECVTFLLANKALPDLHDGNSDTALDRAVEGGNLEVVRALLQWRADVNLRSNKDRQPGIIRYNELTFTITPKVKGDTHPHRLIRTAAIQRVIHAHRQYNNSLREGGSFSILSRALAGVGAFKYDTMPMQGLRFNEGDLFSLPLKCKRDSIRTSITSIIKLFLKYKADLEISTGAGETAYLLAARALDRPIIELLYSQGANIRAEDSHGRNAIMLAVISTHYWMMLDERAVEGLRCLQFLIDQGVPVNDRDKEGRTPLMIAAHYENVKILKLLLSAGADVHAVRTERIDTAPLTGSDVRTTTIEITALSILLEKQSLDYMKNTICAKKLIRHGAVNSLPERFNNLLHDLIEDDIDKRTLIELLLRNDMAPTMSGSPPTSNAALSLSGPYRSLLMVALHDGFVPVIKFLLGNLMLCPCDISAHSYRRLWRGDLIARNEMEIVDIMDEFYSEPKSLFQLSFVQVSYSLGGVPGRRERVRCLPVSRDLQYELLFQVIHVPMDFPGDA